MNQKRPLDILHDNRMNCYSVLVTLPMKEYLEMVKPIYNQKDVLEKQRSALKTSSAKKIRARMIEDLSKGSVLPPVVIGIVLTEEELGNIITMSYEEFLQKIDETPNDSKAIVDGMQRTTAMLEVMSNEKSNETVNMRIEFWIADNINSLIYRMLVLNTGQVPWDLRRQVEVLFNPVITELKKSVTEIEIIEIDQGNRRTKAGQYQANDIIELFLAFGLKTHKTDIKEAIAVEFSRLDFIEATGNKNFLKDFKISLEYLAKLDKCFSIFTANKNGEDSGTEILKKGFDIFSKQTARIGFIVAFARDIFGKTGIERSQEEIEKRLEKAKSRIDQLLEKITNYDATKIGEFLNLEIINEMLAAPKKGKIGDIDREIFLAAFEEMIKNADDIENMISCWRAYQ